MAIPFPQQQIHAQQIPGGPPQPIPALGALAGPLTAFGGPMGLGPHGGAVPQSLLKAPPDLHREDLKVPLGGPSAEERMVSWLLRLIFFCLFCTHRMYENKVL